MKRALLLLALLLSATHLTAQEQAAIGEQAVAGGDIQVGITAGFIAGYNTTDYHVSQIDRGLGFAPAFGAQAQFKVSPSNKIIAGIGYHTLAFTDKHNNRIAVERGEGDNSTRVLPGVLTTEGEFNYIAVSAYFKVSAFFIGMNVGIPGTATLTNTIDGATPSDGYYDIDGEYRIAQDISPEKSDINTLFEIRAGADFPLLEEDIGDLNLGFSLGWTLGNIIKSSGDNLPVMEDQFHIPSVAAHLSWLFNI